MEFIIATLSSLFAAAGGQIAAVIAGIVAVFGAIFYHRTKVTSAEKTGRDDGAAIERDRIRHDTDKATDAMEQRADEIEENTRRDTADRDDLLDRMRRNASDHRSK